MRVLVPAYFYPGAYWDRLASQAFSMPEKIIAIAHASNGPGAAVDPNYINAIGNLRVNGGKVIGYVFTNYGKRPQNKVRKDIDLWFSFYTIDGIFLDQQAYTPGKEEYYQELYNYIKTINPQAFIVGNPGTDTIESYLFYNDNRVTDVLCFFETNTGFLNWEPPSWIYKYKNTNFCVLPYNTSASEYEAITDYADVKNAGWVYCTDDVLPNPWDTLPDYFESFSDYVNTKTK
jgi:hypothetical protein